jgi:hypothetical protein
MISPEREFRKGVIETITGGASAIGGVALGLAPLCRSVMSYLEAGMISAASLHGEPAFQLESGSKLQIVVGAALVVSGVAVAQQGERHLVHAELLKMADGQS